MKINKLTIFSIALSTLLFSCNEDEQISNTKDYSDGVLVSGEGSSAGTGSVSFVSTDFSSSEQLIFKNVNNSELGTYLQSLAFSSTNAYISVDNQNTITVVDRYSFEEVTKITEGLRDTKVHDRCWRQRIFNKLGKYFS